MAGNTEAIVIELEGVPVGKGRPRFARGRAYTPAKTRTYEQALGLAAKEAMRGRKPLAGPLSVDVYADCPIPKSFTRRKREAALMGKLHPTTKPDSDNILKCLDALNGIVFVDDAQIVDARIVKNYSAKPMLGIYVQPLESSSRTKPVLGWPE